MRASYRSPLLLVLVLVLVLVACTAAQEASSELSEAAVVKALGNAMDPGEGQKKLEPMVGEFDVKIRVWLDPAQPPIESMAVAVSTWVLGKRYVQTMLSGYVMGEPFDGIGYAGYDNVSKQYQATFMDTGGTGMEWFSGSMDPTGGSAKLSATIPDPITGEATTVEMRLKIAASGDHVTELWQEDPTGEPVRIMDLQYTRKKS
jgi:hypothetical protein